MANPVYSWRERQKTNFSRKPHENENVGPRGRVWLVPLYPPMLCNQFYRQQILIIVLFNCINSSYLNTAWGWGLSRWTVQPPSVTSVPETRETAAQSARLVTCKTQCNRIVDKEVIQLKANCPLEKDLRHEPVQTCSIGTPCDQTDRYDWCITFPQTTYSASNYTI